MEKFENDTLMEFIISIDEKFFRFKEACIKGFIPPVKKECMISTVNSILDNSGLSNCTICQIKKWFQKEYRLVL